MVRLRGTFGVMAVHRTGEPAGARRIRREGHRAPRGRRERGDGSYDDGPGLDVPFVNLTENLLDPVLELPIRVVAAERSQVTDPPAVVSSSRFIIERPNELPSGDPLAQLDRLEHGAVRVPPTAGVVDGAGARARMKR